VLAKHVSGRVGVSLGDVYHGILPYIARSQPVRISDLAQMLQLEVPTVSRHLAVLDRLGMVTRTPHPDDGRSTLVSLSPNGEAVLKETLASWIATLDDVMGDWEDPAVIEFSAALAEFSESLATLVQRLNDRGELPIQPVIVERAG
jgi:DNA-binding MarR family transcriptional regulator